MDRSGAARLVAALALGWAAAGPALAEFVTLRTRDGSVAITGQLAGFADGTYTLSTNIGMVTLSSEMVDCIGESCPALPEDLGFRLAGSRALADRLVPGLVAAFAAGRGGGASWRTPEGGTAYALSEDAEEGDGGAVIVPGASADGLAELASGTADLAMASRRATGAEAKAFAARTGGALREFGQEHTVALDGLVLSVHPSSALLSIGPEEAARVLSGEIGDWADLGRVTGPVTVYAAAPGSGSREMAEDLLLGPLGLSLTAGAVVLEDDEAVAEALGSDPDGLAVTGFARQGGRALAVGGSCGLRVVPTPFTIRTGDYPLARPLVLYGSAPAGAAREFLEFAASPEGQSMVAGAGLVPLAPGTRGADAEGTRLAAALARARTPDDLAALRELAMLFLGAERFGARLGFEPGTERLDPLGQADLFRLAALLPTEGEGHEAVFLGFAAPSGDAAADRARSLERAERVRRAVLAAWPGGRLRSRALGFGTLSPVACEASPSDDRVEVWLRRVPPGDGS